MSFATSARMWLGGGVRVSAKGGSVGGAWCGGGVAVRWRGRDMRQKIQVARINALVVKINCEFWKCNAGELCRGVIMVGIRWESGVF